jgi:3-oxoacyl-[acyl-carrier protein] reductase
MHPPLSGRTALVTGASRGIGRAIALRLARDGAAVAVNFREQAGHAQSVTTAIQSAGGRAISIQGDVADGSQVREMVERATRELGPIDILVNNAGVFRRGDIEDFDFAQMDGMRRVNVDGLVACTRAVMESMKQRGFGRVINLTSIAAVGTAMPGTTFYAATKAAVAVLTRRFAMDLGAYGITVNAIAPGFILTDMVSTGRGQDEVQTLLEEIAGKSMVRRVGTPEDIAQAAAFLADPASGFITGQVLTIDGGRMDYIGHP